MTFDQVDFFMSCAACLNFSLAAKYHFVSVSTLSRSISAIEDELGIKLFERGYHGHKLTEAGRDFFDCCIKNSIELNKYLHKWRNNTREFIYIGCHPYDSSFEKIINCHHKAPTDYLPKKIRIYFIPEGEMQAALEENFINIAIERRGNEPAGSEYKTIPFCRSEGTEYVFCCRDDIDANLAGKLMRMSTYLK